MRTPPLLRLCVLLTALAGPAAYTARMHHSLYATQRQLTASCVVLPANELVARCGGDPMKLARLLSKDELKALCAEHGLPISGTKGVLAPRLLAALPETAASDTAFPAPTGAAVSERPTRSSPRATRVASTIKPAPPPANDGVPDVAEGGEQRQRECETVAESLPSQSTGCDWELTILGSGSCNPSPWRGASCNALRIKDSIWLFDVGEGTQVQLQRCMIKPAKIDKIFVTHAHGDHCFGLPGLLCLISRGRAANAPPVEIYGPQGLRAFVRMSVGFTGTRMLPAYRVHELHGIPSDRKRSVSPPHAPHPGEGRGGENGQRWGGRLRSGEDWGEVEGGLNLTPRDMKLWWGLFDDDTLEVSVSAAPVRHTVPCVGFVVEEKSKGGRLRPELVLPKLLANAEGLREQWGVRDPRVLLKRIKELKADETFELPDGDNILGSDVVGELRRGRKVVLLGDCSDASPVLHLGRGADLLLHEATNSYLPRWGDTGGAAAFERKVISHGHSTPQMAGRCATRMGARALLLTHFSQRYHPAHRSLMRAIKKLAVDSSGLAEDCVGIAYDALTVPVWQPDKSKRPLGLSDDDAVTAAAAAASGMAGAANAAQAIEYAAAIGSDFE